MHSKQNFKAYWAFNIDWHKWNIMYMDSNGWAQVCILYDWCFSKVLLMKALWYYRHLQQLLVDWNEKQEFIQSFVSIKFLKMICSVWVKSCTNLIWVLTCHCFEEVGCSLTYGTSCCSVTSSSGSCYSHLLEKYSCCLVLNPYCYCCYLALVLA